MGTPVDRGGPAYPGRACRTRNSEGRATARGVPDLPAPRRRGRRRPRLRPVPGSARARPLALGRRRRGPGRPVEACRAVSRSGPEPGAARRPSCPAPRGRGLRRHRGLRRRHRGVGRAVGGRHVRPGTHRRRHRDLPPVLRPERMADHQRQSARHDLVPLPGGRLGCSPAFHHWLALYRLHLGLFLVVECAPQLRPRTSRSADACSSTPSLASAPLLGRLRNAPLGCRVSREPRNGWRAASSTMPETTARTSRARVETSGPADQTDSTC